MRSLLRLSFFSAHRLVDHFLDIEGTNDRALAEEKRMLHISISRMEVSEELVLDQSAFDYKELCYSTSGRPLFYVFQ